jgi:conjugal transfer/entry exclusion protein
MRKKFCLFLFVLFISSLANIYSQTLVEIITDSATTVTNQLLDYVEQVQQVSSMVEEVILLTEVVENQILAMESLAEGDFDGVVEFFAYEAETMAKFSSVMDGLTEIKAFSDFTSSDSYETLSNTSDEMRDALKATSNVLYETQDLIDDTQYRLEKSEDLFNLSKSSTTSLEQVQIMNQQMSLLQGQLSDLTKCAVATAQETAVYADAEQLAKYQEEKESETFFETEFSYESIYTNTDYENAVFGR